MLILRAEPKWEIYYHKQRFPRK